MPFGASIARANAKANDVERKLYLRDQTLRLLSGDRGSNQLAVLTSGWNLDDREHIEPPPSGARYFNLFIDDPTGERLKALKEMTVVRIGSELFSIYTKPSFLSAVPSYVFRVQAVGPQF